MTSLRLGTRRSALATTQSGHVADALRAALDDVLAGGVGPARRGRATLREAADTQCERLRALGRKEKTIAAYERVLAQLAASLPRGGNTRSPASRPPCWKGSRRSCGRRASPRRRKAPRGCRR